MLNISEFSLLSNVYNWISTVEVSLFVWATFKMHIPKSAHRIFLPFGTKITGPKFGGDRIKLNLMNSEATCQPRGKKCRFFCKNHWSNPIISVNINRIPFYILPDDSGSKYFNFTGKYVQKMKILLQNIILTSFCFEMETIFHFLRLLLAY